MSGAVPLWAWILVAVIGSGFVTALAPAVLDALKGKERTAAEVASIEADSLVKLEPVWANTVRFMQTQIDDLRAELEAERQVIQRLIRRLDLYEKTLLGHDIPIPVTD